MRRCLRAASLLLPVASACSGPPEPEVFLLGQDIPIASWNVSITSAEMISPGSEAFRVIEAVQPGDKILAIHTEIQYQGTDDADQDREMRTLLGNLWVEDTGTGKYEVAAAPLTESHFRMMKSGSSTTFEALERQAQGVEMDRRNGRWVFLFFIPAEAQGLKLLLQNYRPTEAQPQRALVDLRR